MAEIASKPKTTEPEETEFLDSNVDQVETENLSTKLSNIPVLHSSLQTVSKTCHTIKESNSYVGYGMTVAESSLDTAFKAGKAVLDSRTLAPITNTAMKNIRYLDKEAGIMVDKFLKNDQPENEVVQSSGGVQEISGGTTAECGSLAIRQESMFYFLGRKFVEITSLLIRLPYFGPKYALTTIWGLFQGSSNEPGRKRKERGSMSEEVRYMEPSPVKRKYGDRQSTSSEEGTLVEILRDYVSEDDPDYEPKEHESEESSEESGNESTEADRGENVKECLDLTQELEELGIPLSPETKRDVEKIKSVAKEKGETTKSQSTPKKASDDQIHTNDEKTDKTATQSKSESKIVDSKTSDKTEEKLEEIPLKELTNESKDATEVSKDAKTSKIDPSSKTRRSTKSPLLEKLLSPGRRSRKGQKDKTKSAEKETVESCGVIEDTAGQEGSSKSEDISMKTKSEKMTKISEKSIEDSSKNAVKTAEAKVEGARRSEDGQKDESRKSKAKSEKAKSESSMKGEMKTDESRHEPLSTITGPFDVFKFGGKKTK